MQLYRELKRLVEKGYVKKNFDLTDYNSYRLEAVAKICVIVNSIETFIKTMKVCERRGVKPIILGNGTNVILARKVIDGVVMIMGKKFNRIDRIGNLLQVESGATLAEIIKYSTEEELSGIEGAMGIPASIGGAVYMNASAFDFEMSNIVNSVLVYSNGKITVKTGEELKFGYRHSSFQDSGDIIIRVELRLTKSSKSKIEEKTREIISLRSKKIKSPYPNAGSVFKNGNNYFAGELIDKCGLKNYNIGNAYVSQTHANFIENRGKATASEIIGLIEHIKKVVLDKFDVKLELEQKIIGE